jgi:ring-1,2-phenylacetyl-CoA epoxidase subunit PaaC
MDKKNLFKYVQRLGDDRLVLGHRLSEWCGHGPVLEEDIALTNVALDLVGQARMYLSYAGDLKGDGSSEDDLAYMRLEHEYHNLLITERPNGHFGDTIARQFLFDAYHHLQQSSLLKSKDEQLAAIASKAIKEVSYHLRHSSEWIIRLGDGTEESHKRIQQSLEDIWRFTEEMFVTDQLDNEANDAGIGPDPEALKAGWDKTVNDVLTEAGLKRPEDGWMASGGRSGIHSEHMGFILTEMQYVQRAYPGQKW